MFLVDVLSNKILKEESIYVAAVSVDIKEFARTSRFIKDVDDFMRIVVKLDEFRLSSFGYRINAEVVYIPVGRSIEICKLGIHSEIDLSLRVCSEVFFKPIHLSDVCKGIRILFPSSGLISFGLKMDEGIEMYYYVYIASELGDVSSENFLSGWDCN